MDEDGNEVRRRRWPRRLRIGAGVLLLALVLAVAIVWTMRVRIATDFIDREFARRGVEASYDVKRIGFGAQIFENLVIGDRRRPDLVARRVEVQIRLGLSGPRVGLITARGVRLNGRIEGGRLRLGQVDRLLPPPSGLPFRLPDQRVDVDDAAIALDTPAGQLALAVSGRGNLADGFRGGLAIVSRELRLGECRIARPIARFTVRVVDLRPRIHGPLAMQSVRCGDALAVDRPLFDVRAMLAAGIDGWRGATVLRAARLQSGSSGFAGLQGRLTFDGNADDTHGTLELASAAAAAGMMRSARTRLAGRYAVSPRRGDLSLLGEVAVDGLVVRDDALASIAGALRGAAGTPVGPIADALAAAMLRAGRGGADGRAVIRLAGGDGRGAFRVGDLRLDSRSGAHLVAAGGDGFTYQWPGGAVRLDGAFALSGGGFPDARFTLVQAGAGAPLRGTGRIAPMAAGNARLALGDIGFTATADGRTSFRTVATLDGPLGGGRVTGLSLPLSGRFGRGGFSLGEGCVSAGFRALHLQNLRLGPSRLPLCPVGRALLWSEGGGLMGGAELRALRLAGRLGDSPIALTSGRLRVDLAGFAATAVAARLGAGDGINRLDAAGFSGRFVAGGAAGRFDGLVGDLASVPLLLSEGTGSWQFSDGNLAMEGHVAIADRERPGRFHPVVSDDFRLTLASDRIRATGWLNHPASGTRVALATIEHDLGTGAGNAVLDVDDLRFAPGFQPDALTPATVGVVALVDGSLSGQGRIEWDGAGTRSSGTFSTADMDLAVPFGPVEGIATTIRFTDLLGLTSAPGQTARIGLIRTGIDVYDGEVRYQLQPNSHIAIESAAWPLAGGTLALEPTILDFSQESTKYLTFRVTGLDAARFIQLMEFSNLDATGTFDGTIPMQFTQAGGRVANGRLTAREGGGTLSYIGELSDRDLGAYGVLAFDALKSLRYSRFDITLDGSLDGEFLTRIDLDGIARNPAGTREPGGGISGMVVGRVLGQLARIPFNFNIRIAGPFRALVATARSFEDPADLIRASLPQLLEERDAADSTVQPQESEPVP